MHSGIAVPSRLLRVAAPALRARPAHLSHMLSSKVLRQTFSGLNNARANMSRTAAVPSRSLYLGLDSSTQVRPPLQPGAPPIRPPTAPPPAAAPGPGADRGAPFPAAALSRASRRP